MDRLSREKRSWNMSRIRDRDTKPEIAVRAILHQMGYTIKVNQRTLPGKPDIVLPACKTVIFVHGCFWHRHRRCRFAYNPKSKKAFWERKFAYNTAHDQTVKRKLWRSGWSVITVWECELTVSDKLTSRLTRALNRIEQRRAPTQR